jgi:hypothetical protein
MPSPPPDALERAPEGDGLTPRQYSEAVNATEGCNLCHRLMDPIGLGLAAYDPVGRYAEGVDDSGEIIGVEPEPVPFEGARELGEYLARSPDVRRCYAEQWFVYALGRLPEDADRCALDAIDARFAETNTDVRELLVAIAASDSFRYRTADGEEGSCR